MLTTFSTLITGSAIFVLAIAVYNDIRTLRIPNWTCIAIVVLGILRMLVLDDLNSTLYTIASFIIVLVIGLLLFARRIVGGGDAKLLAATVLLIGYHDLLSYLFVVSICGAMIAVLMLVIKHSPLPIYLGPKFAAFAVTTQVMVPFGVAISIGSTFILLCQLYVSTANLMSQSYLLW